LGIFAVVKMLEGTVQGRIMVKILNPSYTHNFTN